MGDHHGTRRRFDRGGRNLRDAHGGQDDEQGERATAGHGIRVAVDACRRLRAACASSVDDHATDFDAQTIGRVGGRLHIVVTQPAQGPTAGRRRRGLAGHELVSSSRAPSSRNRGSLAGGFRRDMVRCCIAVDLRDSARACWLRTTRRAAGPGQ